MTRFQTSAQTRPRRSRIPGKRRRSHIRVWSRCCGTPCTFDATNYRGRNVRNLQFSPMYTVVLAGPIPPWPH